MLKCKYAIVVLVYRNIDDLEECINSFQASIDSCRIIVVNAFYDDSTNTAIQQLSTGKNCDFISIPNKGYGYGNNAGIAYAQEHYDYEFLIVSNPDITIERFDDTHLMRGTIYAPKIINLAGNNQNPMVIRRNALSEYLVYSGLKKNNKICFCLGLGLGKASRFVHGILKKRHYTIYQAHGSFVILHKSVIDLLHPIYDERMFLFAEEGVLALKANRFCFPTVYVEDIIIRHKEDGSMAISDLKLNEEMKKSNIFFYENYCMKNDSI